MAHKSLPNDRKLLDYEGKWIMSEVINSMSYHFMDFFSVPFFSPGRLLSLSKKLGKSLFQGFLF